MSGKNRQAQRRSINDFKSKNNMRTPNIYIPKETDFKPIIFNFKTNDLIIETIKK